MEKVETSKDIELKDRKWRLKKFDARTGSYMVFKLLGLLTPILGNAPTKVEEKPSELNFTKVFEGLNTLSEEDFVYIQEKCLSVCYEVLPSGETQVLNKNGTFGVMSLEQDTMTVMALTVHALIFNVSGFFGESLLASFPGMQTIFQQSSKT